MSRHRQLTYISKWVEFSQKYHMGTKSFGVSCEEAEDTDDWSLRIKAAVTSLMSL